MRSSSSSSYSQMQGSLSQYLSRINKYPVLDRETELALARKWRDEGDREAAQKLITSNLRFVVKISQEYRTYGIKLADLIQEGNIGLMQAVNRFDPDKGYRLISYAVWWIRAYIHNFILRSWSLVKLGTTQAQRRLFYQLNRAKRRISGLQSKTEPERVRILSEKLDASEDEIREMERRLSGRDLPLDVPIGDDTDTTYLDLVPAKSPSQEDQLVDREEREVLREKVAQIIGKLPKRERYILEKRILSEKPMTLRSIGEKFGISRERVRQLETATIERIRAEVAPDLGVEAKGPIRYSAED
jgi:RNA polymerase sigma-32 factor